MADELPKKKDAGILEGDLKPVAQVLNLAFSMIGISMLQNLALTAGTTLSSPAAKLQPAKVPVSNFAAPAVAPMRPKAPTFH
jgi:hypothetical protein